ncbi:MAG TPA: hypothetical protein PK533_01550, partial [Rectinema sp.]|nr:hypothetical protein [Rectinema sp.]
MAVIFKIAFRNIKAHRSKSLIIGILLAMGAMVLVFGTAFINATEEGVRSTFSDVYTGDIFISGISSDGPVSLFGVTSTSGMAETPIIPEYDKVLSIVKSTPHLKKTSSLATGFSQVIRENGDQMTKEDSQNKIKPQDRFLFLFGIDAATYWDLFETVEIVAGEKLKPGQSGIMINESQFYKFSDWFE